MDVLQKAIDKWGPNVQAGITVGECGELIAALTRYFVQGRGNDEEVMGEIADVEIMCSQMRLIFNTNQIDNIKKVKLERLENIISGKTKHPHG